MKHLENAMPTSEQVEQAVRRLNLRIAIPIVAATVAVGGAAAYVVSKKRARAAHNETESQPACLTDFESSLRKYVEAGRTGALTVDIIDNLMTDLDVLKDFSESANEVRISLDELVPLFDLVIAHTPRLADAYKVDLEALTGPDDESPDGAVFSLRRHLEAQKAILSDVA